MWSTKTYFADVFIGCETVEGLEPSPDIIGGHEIIEMRPQLLMAVVMEAFDSCILDRAVHPLKLPIRPGMTGFRQAMFDPVGLADPVKAHGTRLGRIAITGLFSELAAVIDQNGMNPIRDNAQEMFEEFPGRLPVGFLSQLCDGKFTRPINGHKEIQLTLSGLDLGDIEMKEPNRVTFETLPLGLVSLNVRQA